MLKGHLQVQSGLCVGRVGLVSLDNLLWLSVETLSEVQSADFRLEIRTLEEQHHLHHVSVLLEQLLSLFYTHHRSASAYSIQCVLLYSIQLFILSIFSAVTKTKRRVFGSSSSVSAGPSVSPQGLAASC